MIILLLLLLTATPNPTILTKKQENGVVSALVMVICGLLMKKPKLKWLGEYALPISLVAGMAAAIPLTNWLG